MHVPHPLRSACGLHTERLAEVQGVYSAKHFGDGSFIAMHLGTGSQVPTFGLHAMLSPEFSRLIGSRFDLHQRIDGSCLVIRGRLTRPKVT